MEKPYFITDSIFQSLEPENFNSARLYYLLKIYKNN